MNWYTWSSLENFNSWHSSVIAGLGLPRIGYNSATGLPEPGKQMTTSYTEVTEVAENDWRAPVQQDIADIYLDGLGSLSTSPIEGDVI